MYQSTRAKELILDLHWEVEDHLFGFRVQMPNHRGVGSQVLHLHPSVFSGLASRSTLVEQTTPTAHSLFDTSALPQNLDFLDIDVALLTYASGAYL